MEKVKLLSKECYNLKFLNKDNLAQIDQGAINYINKSIKELDTKIICLADWKKVKLGELPNKMPTLD